MSEELRAIGPEPARDPDAGQSATPAVDLPVNLPIDYEAFTLTYRGRYLRVAEEILGDRAAAEKVVHQVLVQIATHWPQLLAGPDVVVTAWGLLCHALRFEVRRRESDPELLARLERLRVMLAQMRAALPDFYTVDDDGRVQTGLFEQLGRLTPRQFDIVILRAAKRSTFFIAWFLGTHPSTVDRNLKRALAQLEEGLRPARVLKSARPTRRGARR
ncbi:RNA polymerase sigma factor [Kitasatospora sp. NPDC058184]|uniref:RNA polymerase sigma factor n=1 Tax=Kitasatospora sp. NPDC058184 TaxID=3346370 RepID=UPI0036D8E4EE